MRFLIPLLIILLMAARPAVAGDETVWLAPKAVGEFYKQRSGRLAWLDPVDYAGLLSTLEGLTKHGLDPKHYHLDDLRKYSNDQRKRDRLATDAWFSAAAHMIYGKLDPQSVEPRWTAAGRSADLHALLDAALANNGVEFSLDLLAPRQPGYWALVGALAKSRARLHAPQTTITPGHWLKIGDTGARVSTLQKRLIELELLETSQENGIFDGYTDRSLRLFQRRAGLEADGIMGPQTLQSLNRSAAHEVDQIRVNLERWRWLPDDLGRRHIRVNIAAFDLTAWQDGAVARSYPIIVGTTYRQTPVFFDEVEYIVFNPWWETPTSLAREDKLPMFREDPQAVTKLGYQVIDNSSGKLVDPATIDWNTVSADAFPYRLRQQPGALNALGRVKIMFPNAHNVYIHDTPQRELFNAHLRTYSSGCIRTKNVLKLAEWLLQDSPEWDEAHINEAVESGKTIRADLNLRVPVYILYMTAFVKNYGVIRFVNDIYGRDKAVLTGLNAVPR